ncbi:MAG TPA: hypothetical protein VM432_00790 [Bdellovibrionales bacterium]|nr:hypothetical protein [Bdellovibrionales bacterium]
MNSEIAVPPDSIRALHRVSIDTLLKDLRALAATAKKSAVSFDIYRTQNVPEQVSSDSFRLRQALFDIVGRVLNFTDQGEVSITVDMTTQGLLSFTVASTSPTCVDMWGESISRRLVGFLGGELKTVISRAREGSILQLTIDPNLSAS